MFRRRKIVQPRWIRSRSNAFEQLEERRLFAGLTASGNEIWHHGMPEIPDGSVPLIEGLRQANDQFGNVLTVGDFNGDTFPDLAIGSTKHEQFVHEHEGEDAVNILYGSSSGLTTAGNQQWDQDSPGIAGTKEEGDRFGHALAAGDLNRDGYDDLVIGAPGENNATGAVHILFGSQDGLTAADSRLILGNSAGDQFGRALAIGDMDNNGRLDLAVGAPHVFNGEGMVSIYIDPFEVTNSIHFQQFGGGSGREDDDRFGFSLAMGDFDRDGFDDLVVGVPGENSEGIVFDEIDTGAVNIFRGGPGLLAGDGHQFWNQDSSGILDSTGDLNEFGYSLAVGDFNGDAVEDLAIGVPGETENGHAYAGAVNIIYGSVGGGLTSAGNEYLHQDSPRIAGVPEFGDNFGYSLAAGDFDGDFRTDLIVGVPREDTNIQDVGAFHILPGRPSGLEPDPNGPLVEVITENTNGLTGSESFRSFFGNAMVAADFDQDGKADLALGAPGDSNSFPANDGIGAVHAIYGTSGSFETDNHQIWKQGEGQSEPGLQDLAKLGTSVAAGDFNGDGYEDMATGIPQLDLPAEQRWGKNSAGAVNVVYGYESGLDEDTAEIWTQSRLAHPSTGDDRHGAEFGDEFGTSLATGDFNADGFDDLAIGSPNENLDGGFHVGMVNIVYGSSQGLTAAIDLRDFFAARNEFLWQGESSIANSPDAFDQFGRALAVGDFDDDGFDDLAVGIPGEEINAQAGRDSGAVQVFYGGASGFHTAVDGHVRDQLWTVNSANIDVPMREEEFGTSLTVGDFDGDGVDDLAIGAPDSTPSTFFTASGFVSVMYGTSSTGLSAIGNHGLFGFSTLQDAQDRFGYSLAAGDLNGDGRDDLAVGAPFDSTPGLPPIIPGANDVGTVNVYYGATEGLAHNQYNIWQQSNSGGATSAIGVAQEGDHFGYALTIGDFDADGFGDLVIGVPERGTGIRSGEANAIYGAATGLDATRQQVWSQDSPGILDSSDSEAQFGASLASGDFNGDGASDLLVGAPLEDIGVVAGVGLVHTIYGGQTQTGDFDDNGVLDGNDVDALAAVAAAGLNNPGFDLTGDGAVTASDVHYWVTELKGTLLGDANLDYVVDGSDFVIWNSHKFTPDTRWTHGNFNGDTTIDGSDFLAWNANKFSSALPADLTDPEEGERVGALDLVFAAYD